MQTIEDLECYLVGGAVRDELLGRAVVDRDWVVVGSTPAQMEALGFLQVGRDFPVYLHPDTHDEYALARTERKQGSGHRGFTIHADPSVSLEEDLCRRDLTINAIAKNASGELIDPHQGATDLGRGVLRHVSAAFAEDPLRVFRVARFAAQLPEFRVAPDTHIMMQTMVSDGELRTLSAERVWQELDKALAAAAPLRFFQVLQDCQGLGDWLIEIRVDLLDFKTAGAATRFAELPLDQHEFNTLAARLKVPGSYLQGALDRLAWADILLTWQSVAGAAVNDAFVALKVVHSAERLAWVVRWLDAVTGADLQEVLELAKGWREVGIDGREHAGRAYGEALRVARIAWLDRRRGPNSA